MNNISQGSLDVEMSPVTILPHEVIEKLAELDLELSEGDITQKGYEKKRRKLLLPFMTQHNESNGHLQSEHNNSGPSNISLHTSSQENTSSNILNKLPDKTEVLGGVSFNKELLSPDSQLLQSQSAKN